MKIIITWICFIGVIVLNALANILPINGYNTGQISAFYPNAFVPAGFTFSIWGIIYMMLLLYTIAFTYYTIKQDQYEHAYAFVEQVNVQFIITCFLNMAWILAWHYLKIELSVLIMLFLLSTLIWIFLKTNPQVKNLNLTQIFFLQTPFVVYLGWISVATIANITALLVAFHWNGMGIQPSYWSAVMIFIAFLLAWYTLYRYRIIAFSLVVAWAFWGIYKAQGPIHPFLSKLTATGIGFLIAATLFTCFKRDMKIK